jgi:integrase
MQVLRFAGARGWAICPQVPPLPPRPVPVFNWVNEALFRAIRDEIFSRGERVAPEVYARRRVYLSWLFYTGAHTADADALTTDALFLDGGAYIRHNEKSARVVPDEQFEMPEPLIDDLRELERGLGHELWPGSPFAGGPWPHVARIVGRAARRLGVAHPVNPRVLRRSFAREMFQRGYAVQEVADRMGHVDLRMLHEVYVRTPRAAGAARSKWKRPRTPAPGVPPRGNGLATVTRLEVS